jgi:type I restriction enzyme S subunit
MNYSDHGNGPADIPLPSSWSHATLGDVCLDPQYGWTTSASIDGDLPLVRTTDISSGAIDWRSVPYCEIAPADAEKYLLDDGDILISRAGSVGKSFLIRIPKRSVFASYLIRFRPLIDERYINFFLQTQAYWNQISESTSGIAIPNVNANKLRRVKLPVAPIAEQRRIADKIDELFSELDAGVASLKWARRLLKKYRQAVLKAAVSGELTRDWRERHKGDIKESGAELLQRILEARRVAWEAAELKKLRTKGKPPKDDRWKQKYQEPRPPDTAGLPALPEGWVWVSIGQIFDVFIGSTPSRAEQRYWGGDVPWVSSGEVAFCRIKQTRETITQAGLRNSGTRLHPRGTVLLGIIGEGKTRGQAAILDIEACNNQNAAAIRVSSTAIPSEYVYYYLLWRYETTRRESSGGNQPALNRDRVKEFMIPLPSLAELAEHVSELDSHTSQIEKLESAIGEQLRVAGAIRQSILKAAFAGRLLPQDPNDEPASVLLERIRAERAARPKPARGRRTAGRSNRREDQLDLAFDRGDTA